MCCCCPPAIEALFCLWCKSGFSKSAVAGALTFFPPDPPLYKFHRISKDGVQLPEFEDDVIVDSDDDSSDDDSNDESILDQSDLEYESGMPSDRAKYDDMKKRSKSANKKKGKGKKKKSSDKKKKKKKDPAAQLTERNLKLRKRAKTRNSRDRRDAATKVKYRFEPDPRLAKPPRFSGSMEAVKIGPQKKTGAYVAAVIYRVRKDKLTDRTKTIIYSHGNATDVGAMHYISSVLARSCNVNVVAYDYSGYGASGGIPLEANTYRDIKMVYKYTLEQVADGDESNIVVYGQSVGSGPSCYIASKRENVGGLILHSPFMSGMRVLTPSRALACLDIFPNIDRIKKVNCPVMVIHGQLDEEVDVAHGVALHNAVKSDLRRECWWVPDRGHNDITDGPGKMTEYVRRLKVYLSQLE